MNKLTLIFYSSRYLFTTVFYLKAVDLNEALSISSIASFTLPPTDNLTAATKLPSTIGAFTFLF